MAKLKQQGKCWHSTKMTRTHKSRNRQKFLLILNTDRLQN